MKSSKSTESKLGHILSTQPKSEETPKENSTLVEREKLQGTPYYAIKQNEKWFLALGMHMITEPVDTKEQAIEKLQTENWDILFHTVCVISAMMIDENNQKKAGL